MVEGCLGGMGHIFVDLIGALQESLVRQAALLPTISLHQKKT